MTAAAEILLQSALLLSVEERSRIATRLIESVDEEDTTCLTPEWQVEIEQRIDSIRDGSARLISHEDVMGKIKSQLKERRGASPS